MSTKSMPKKDLQQRKKSKYVLLKILCLLLKIISEDMNKTKKLSCIKKNIKAINEVINDNYFKESEGFSSEFWKNTIYVGE